MALAAFVLSIIGLALCWVPALGVLLALVALILGIVAMVKKAPKRGFALTGVITGAAGVVAGGIVSFIMLSGILFHFDDARVSDAHLGACSIDDTVARYMAEHPGTCPSFEELKGPYLEATWGTLDPWEQEYVIDCSSGKPDVYSLGPDGQGGEPIRCEKSLYGRPIRADQGQPFLVH